MAYHYYQVNDGKMTVMSEFEQDGFLYSEEELVKDYKGEIVPISALDSNDYKLKKEEYENEQKKDELRIMRENECFSIINRGQLWYDMLTEDKKTELKVWYAKWLNVTETMEIPEKPSWL